MTDRLQAPTPRRPGDDRRHRLQQEMDAVASRVQRIANGWEAQLAISVEASLSQQTGFELVEALCGMCHAGPRP